MNKRTSLSIRSCLLVSLIPLVFTGCSLIGGQSERPENAVIKGINYVGITVSDIDRSAQMYMNAFALNVVNNQDWRSEPATNSLLGRDQARLRTRLLRSSNSQLRLFEFAASSEQAQSTPFVEVNGPGIAHVCVQVAAQTESYQKFLKGGATPVGSPDMVQLNPRNPVHYAYARDHDGTMFEVEHVEVAKLNLETPPKNTHRLRHVALASPDIDRLVGFYSTLLEQERPRRLGKWKAMSGQNFDDVSGLAGTELKMAFFDVRNMELEIAEYPSHPTKLPATNRPLDALGHSLIVFDVTNLVDARRLLLLAGGSVELESSIGGNAILIGRDPDGNLLGFQSLDASSELSAQNFDGDGT